jgi:hypothetical protein
MNYLLAKIITLKNSNFGANLDEGKVHIQIISDLERLDFGSHG